MPAASLPGFTTAGTLVYSLATIEWDAVASATAYGRYVGAVTTRELGAGPCRRECAQWRER